MIYFTSDLHLGHKNVLNFCNRPFNDIDDMDETIINNWNKVVGDKDEVYILGDITLTRSWKVATNYIRQLKGKKYLIKGNHDKYLYSDKFDRRYFELIAPYHEMDYEGKKLVLCHFPIADWSGKFRGSIHVHGHIHSHHWSNLQEMMGKIYDAGVDANDYTPVSIVDVIERCKCIQGFGMVNEFITRRRAFED